MNVVIIQPPLVQLNTPYPSGAYLQSFFKQQNIQKLSFVKWFDLSNSLFHEIFSKEGLTKLFQLSQQKALFLADQAEKDGDENTAFNLRRYIIEQDKWITWIDTIKAILCDNGSLSGRELCHEFIFSPFSPRGNRMEKYLSDLQREVTIDDARFLASFALADLADFITIVYDSNFSLIRYAEHLATSEKDFSKFEQTTNSPILSVFFEQVLQKFFLQLDNSLKDLGGNQKTLFCITVPFAGCFASTLACCKAIKQHYNNSIISIGGGYINTELRDTTEIKLADYIDFISYDRGYGSYIDLLTNDFSKENIEYYKTTYFNKDKLILSISENTEKYAKLSLIENEYTRTIFPDYSEIDFSLYPRLADDINPMHRIWSDGSWLKAYLAHGCYWHRCAFCDTSLDYVCKYLKIDTKKLYHALTEQAKQTGIYGIHFVDEASPPKSLIEFGLENCKTQNHRLTFWGNIRFEKTFTRDLADFLVYSGLTGVSGGIEIATGEGLKEVNKGTDFQSLISACASFKEAGILVHAYMIYGFYSETAQDLINSMETLRQLFANGLLDSAFWHKFVLTKHSTLFTEYKKGLHPKLKPIINTEKTWFAQNDIHFEGEQKSNKYTLGLEIALQNWMHYQNLNKSVQSWFSFEMPKPTISKNYVENAIKTYEIQKNQLYNDYSQFCTDIGNYYWLGGKIVLLKDAISNQLSFSWIYLGEIQKAFFDKDINQETAQRIISFVQSLEPTNDNRLQKAEIVIPKSIYKLIRGQGLCRIL